MAETGLQELETYLSLSHNTVVQFIATRPIIDLFLAAERRLWSRMAKRWWDQEGLDFGGMQTEAQEAEWAEREEDTDGTDTDFFLKSVGG